jgi:hypothetical protein
MNLDDEKTSTALQY